MEFRKMVTVTLYARQQKRHRCIEQSFGLCGRGRGWDDLGECHGNMYNIIYEMNCQSRFDAWYWMLGAGALRWPRRDGTGREEEGGFRMGNMCIPVVDSCWCMAKPIQYCKVKKRKKERKKKLWNIYTVEYYSAVEKEHWDYYKVSQKGKILYSNAYIPNLEKWYWRIYLHFKLIPVSSVSSI